MITRNTWRRLATVSSRPVKVKPTSTAARKKYAFYDLVLRTPTHPQHPIEASLMTSSELSHLKEHTKTRFVGNYSIDESVSAEERIAKVFGGRIKGETRQSSSRILRGEPRLIAGVNVPDRPPEPDNCCMSGCINCVWELFDEDIKEWNDKRKKAAHRLVKNGGRWPENFHAPLKYLHRENYPESLEGKSDEELGLTDGDANNDAWGNVPVFIKAFAELEKKLKEKKSMQAQ